MLANDKTNRIKKDLVMKTSFKVCGKDIIISRDDWQAITTNHRDLYSIVSKKEWRKDSHGYIVNSSLGYLHRYVMQFWYGEEMLHEMTKCGFVVDHLNNNPEDCRLSNLEFLRKAYNTAKGQVFDVDSKNAKNHTTSATLNYPGVFSYICPLSCGIRESEELDAQLQGIKKAGYKLYWIGVGKDDTMAYQGSLVLDRHLTDNGMKHTLFVSEDAHVWKNWRLYLNTFARLLFK